MNLLWAHNKCRSAHKSSKVFYKYAGRAYSCNFAVRTRVTSWKEKHCVVMATVDLQVSGDAHRPKKAFPQHKIIAKKWQIHCHEHFKDPEMTPIITIWSTVFIQTWSLSPISDSSSHSGYVCICVLNTDVEKTYSNEVFVICAQHTSYKSYCTSPFTIPHSLLIFSFFHFFLCCSSSFPIFRLSFFHS